ncbi:MAG TPA: hypothetical protein VER33_23900, partial [Polyangiaceae bacterium]|nr:hypothetical protein [Polyangiaceae bacterium]
MHSIFAHLLLMPLVRTTFALFLLIGVVGCGDDDSPDPFPSPGAAGESGAGGEGGDGQGEGGSSGSPDTAGAGGQGGHGGHGAQGGEGGQVGTSGITVTAASGETTEDGGQVTFTVVLDSEPAAGVVLALASDDPSEGTTDVEALTFTPDNWDAPQTVTVTGQDDDEEDGSQDYNVVFEAAVSDDPAYSGLELEALPLTNVDDDTAGITVSPLIGSTSENGETASFLVVLNAMPMADVTIELASNNTSEGTLALSSLVFTPDNWDVAQEVVVTGVDDDVVDPAAEYGIEFAASASDDPAYDGLALDAVQVVNIDNDSAGVTVSPLVGSTSEEGNVATFTVRLSSAPRADVTIGLSSDDEDEGTVAPQSLVFTAQNWAAPRTVTITGVDDDVADGNQPYSIVFAATTSTDAAYAGLTPASVAVINVDDETAGFTLTAISGTTSEEETTATFTIRLTSQPTAEVALTLDSNDPTEGTVSPSSLTFTAVNWNAPRTVTVTGVNDSIADGNRTYAVVFTPATSTDPDYAGMRPANVSVTNVDDETAGFTVSVLDATTSEAGGRAQVSVRLTSEPSANVVLTFASSDPTEATIASSSSLTFTPVNWNAPQIITLEGVDDVNADAD